MIQCPFCNFENEDGALFCDQCKSDLAVAATPIAEASAGAAPLVLQAVEAIPLNLGADAAQAMPAVEIPLPGLADLSPDVVVAPLSPDGTPLVPVDAVPAEASAAPVQATAAAKWPDGSRPKLLVLRGQRINMEYPIYEGENYVGRADEKPVDVDLEDQEPPDRIWSSRQHAVIFFENGTMAIEDLQSTNGTFVNRTRVHAGQKRALQANDVIQIGTVQLKVKA